MPSLISGITPDLQPEFLQVVDYIYRKMVNLQEGTNVLILTDSRMPRKTVIAFQGVAMMMGAEVMVAENRHAKPIPPAAERHVERHGQGGEPQGGCHRRHVGRLR